MTDNEYEIGRLGNSVKALDNMRILLSDGKLCWNNNVDFPLSFTGIILDDGTNEEEFSLEEFAKLEEYIEPKSREEELEERIAELEAQVKAQSIIIEPKQTKTRVIYDQASKLKISQEWKVDRTTEHPMYLKDMAQKYNISSNYLVTILKEFGVYKPKKQKRKITASIDC